MSHFISHMICQWIFVGSLFSVQPKWDPTKKIYIDQFKTLMIRISIFLGHHHSKGNWVILFKRNFVCFSRDFKERTVAEIHRFSIKCEKNNPPVNWMVFFEKI